MEGKAGGTASLEVFVCCPSEGHLGTHISSEGDWATQPPQRVDWSFICSATQKAASLATGLTPLLRVQASVFSVLSEDMDW